MIYERHFDVTSCHFNGELEYDLYEKAFKDETPLEDARDYLLRAMQGSHGHNFRIELTLEGNKHESPWLVDDEVLSAIVMAWNNCHLSLHPDFVGQRATTENMADTLGWKLYRTFPHLQSVGVRVWETNGIKAEVKLCR